MQGLLSVTWNMTQEHRDTSKGTSHEHRDTSKGTSHEHRDTSKGTVTQTQVQKHICRDTQAHAQTYMQMQTL